MSQELKEHIKWLELRCKRLKAALDAAEKGAAQFGMFEDCGDFYNDEVVRCQARLDEAVAIKISTEKYVRKLAHLEREARKETPK